MKTLSSLLVLIGLLAAAGLARGADDLKANLQRGLFEEEANRDLPAAIAAYQAVVAQFDKDRDLAGTAIFRLGECYRKLGKTNEAAQQYRRILNTFADHTTLAKLSRQNLATLGLILEVPAPVTLSRAARLEQKRLIEMEMALVEEQLRNAESLFKTGRASRTDVIAKEREILDLRRQLAALDVGDEQAPAAGAGATAAPVTDEEEKEIRRIQALIRNSPDLINTPGTNGLTPLHQAAASGYLSVARFLLANGAEVNAKATVSLRPGLDSAKAATPLHIAASTGNKAMVELLLGHGADPNAVGEWRKITGAPLHFAAEKGYQAVAEVLLAHKADVNLSPDGGPTPLGLAAQEGHKPVVELLIEHGANVNAKTQWGWTPLHYAAEGGNPAVVELLLAHKAEVDAKASDGTTPLGPAVYAGHAKSAELLLNAGADVNAKRNGTPLLHVAVGRGQNEVLKVLLARKPKLDVTDSSGYTPLQLAITRTQYAGAAEAVRLLLEAGADPDRPFNAVGDSRYVGSFSPGRSRLDTTGSTPLVVASYLGEAAMVTSLLEHGANVDAKSKEGNTALIYAVDQKNLPMLDAILAHDPDTGVRSPNGYTPLSIALEAGEMRIAERLVNAGANVNVAFPRDNDNSLLHLAVLSARPDFVKLFVTNNARVNVVNDRGLTPLDLAQAYARDVRNTQREVHADIAAYLLAHGADEDFTRRSYIAVGREDRSYTFRVFAKGTNDWNRYTLLELIAMVYADPNSPPAAVLPFPDFSRITIQRLGAKNEPVRTIAINAEALLNRGACNEDPWLEWGDIVNIPEADHPVNEVWAGLSAAAREVLGKCLQRDIAIMVKGQRHKVVLQPPLAPEGISLELFQSSVRRQSEKTGELNLAVFRLDDVLRSSGLLRVSSDLGRVVVRRTDPATRKSRQWIVDLSVEEDSRGGPNIPFAAPAVPIPPRAGVRVPSVGPVPYAAVPGVPSAVQTSERFQTTDLWLRDGDVIEVLEKGEPLPPPQESAPPVPSTQKETESTAVPQPGGRWERRADAPLSPRHVNTAIWTGQEMIVFGGEGPGVSHGDGARYDPASDQWTMLPSESVLERGRNNHTAVWTGTEMIIWGGFGGRAGEEPQFYNTGARFNPTANAWKPMSDVGAPSRRFNHSAVWTGTEMIVWGGYQNPAAAYGGARTDDHLGDGGRYDPARGKWRAMSNANAPSKRYGHTAVWTGTEMVVWGGADATRVFNDGARYDPQEDSWRPLPSENAPSPRFLHHALWTGREMIVFGGCERDFRTPVKDAAAFNPKTGQWRKIAQTTPGTFYALAVWTGKDILAWGGWSRDRAAASPVEKNGPPAQKISQPSGLTEGKPAQVQTESNPLEPGDSVSVNREVPILGALPESQQSVARREARLSVSSSGGFINTGVRYDPETDRWIPLTTEDIPAPRGQSKWAAVWTGDGMLFFGGWNGSHYFKDTWLYQP